MVSPASKRHQQIADFLTKILGIYVEQHELGIVLSAPFQMKLDNGRESDVLFVHQENHDRLHETYLEGPADLVVEVVTPESVGRDRGDKFVEYEAGGVPEYWLIDPQREQAEFYQLNDEGRYRRMPVDDGGRYYSSVVTDFWLRVEWLWQEPLPPTEDVLLDVGDEEYAHRLIAQLRERGFLSSDE